MFLLSKLKMYALLVGGIVVTILLALIKVKNVGAELEKAKVLRKEKELQDEFDKIDRQPIDIDGSFDRLRDRNSKD